MPDRGCVHSPGKASIPCAHATTREEEGHLIGSADRNHLICCPCSPGCGPPGADKGFHCRAARVNCSSSPWPPHRMHLFVLPGRFWSSQLSLASPAAARCSPGPIQRRPASVAGLTQNRKRAAKVERTSPLPWARRVVPAVPPIVRRRLDAPRRALPFRMTVGFPRPAHAPSPWSFRRETGWRAIPRVRRAVSSALLAITWVGKARDVVSQRVPAWPVSMVSTGAAGALFVTRRGVFRAVCTCFMAPTAEPRPGHYHPSR